MASARAKWVQVFGAWELVHRPGPNVLLLGAASPARNLLPRDEPPKASPQVEPVKTRGRTRRSMLTSPVTTGPEASPPTPPDAPPLTFAVLHATHAPVGMAPPAPVVAATLEALVLHLTASRPPSVTQVDDLLWTYAAHCEANHLLTTLLRRFGGPVAYILARWVATKRELHEDPVLRSQLTQAAALGLQLVHTSHTLGPAVTRLMSALMVDLLTFPITVKDTDSVAGDAYGAAAGGGDAPASPNRLPALPRPPSTALPPLPKPPTVSGGAQPMADVASRMRATDTYPSQAGPSSSPTKARPPSGRHKSDRQSRALSAKAMHVLGYGAPVPPLKLGRVPPPVLAQQITAFEAQLCCNLRPHDFLLNASAQGHEAGASAASMTLSALSALSAWRTRLRQWLAYEMVRGREPTTRAITYATVVGVGSCLAELGNWNGAETVAAALADVYVDRLVRRDNVVDTSCRQQALHLVRLWHNHSDVPTQDAACAEAPNVVRMLQRPYALQLCRHSSGTPCLPSFHWLLQRVSEVNLASPDHIGSAPQRILIHVAKFRQLGALLRHSFARMHLDYDISLDSGIQSKLQHLPRCKVSSIRAVSIGHVPLQHNFSSSLQRYVQSRASSPQGGASGADPKKRSSSPLPPDCSEERSVSVGARARWVVRVTVPSNDWILWWHWKTRSNNVDFYVYRESNGGLEEVIPKRRYDSHMAPVESETYCRRGVYYFVWSNMFSKIRKKHLSYRLSASRTVSRASSNGPSVLEATVAMEHGVSDAHVTAMLRDHSASASPAPVGRKSVPALRSGGAAAAKTPSPSQCNQVTDPDALVLDEWLALFIGETTPSSAVLRFLQGDVLWDPAVHGAHPAVFLIHKGTVVVSARGSGEDVKHLEMGLAELEQQVQEVQAEVQSPHVQRSVAELQALIEERRRMLGHRRRDACKDVSAGSGSTPRLLEPGSLFGAPSVLPWTSPCLRDLPMCDAHFVCASPEVYVYRLDATTLRSRLRDQALVNRSATQRLFRSIGMRCFDLLRVQSSYPESSLPVTTFERTVDVDQDEDSRDNEFQGRWSHDAHVYEHARLYVRQRAITLCAGWFVHQKLTLSMDDIEQVQREDECRVSIVCADASLGSHVFVVEGPNSGQSATRLSMLVQSLLRAHAARSMPKERLAAVRVSHASLSAALMVSPFALSQHQWHVLERTAVWRQHGWGDVVFRASEPMEGPTALVSGSLALTDGQDCVVGQCVAPCVCGESSLVGDPWWPLTARAGASGATTVTLQACWVHALCDADPDLAGTLHAYIAALLGVRLSAATSGGAFSCLPWMAWFTAAPKRRG